VEASTDDMSRDFLRMLPLRYEALTWAIEEGDGADLGRAASDLRQAAETVGAESLADVCARLETRARDGLLGDQSFLAVELELACLAASEHLAVSTSR
jgi:HPt (histidine-containing phosphotransfer) domain-containing protein